MEENIIDQAGLYASRAQRLLEDGALLDGDAPGYVREALLGLYFAVRLAADMEACQALLTQDTDEETVDAVQEAAQTVQEAAEAAFDRVEQHSAADGDFAAKIDGLALDSAEDGLDDLLCKLYKCEGIIRLAYRCATRYPMYGMPGSMLGGMPDTAPADPEDFIAGDMDVDIMALLDARDALLSRIGPLAGEP
jgi:hypothetical protein